MTIRKAWRTAAALALLGAAGCNTEIALTGNRHPGDLELVPVDAAGACVLGLTVRFTSPDGASQTGVNAFRCSYVIGGEPGEWHLTLTPPAGYALAAGQGAELRVTIARDKTVRVPVQLVAVPR